MGEDAVRRMPVQARSRRRYEGILSSAAEIFAEVGFEAATMEAIASRAGTSIGSLYQFFKNKLAVFEAVAARCLERSRLLSEALMADFDPEAVSWERLLDQIVDGFVLLEETDASFRAISRNLQLYGVFAEADKALTQEFINQTERIVGAYAKGLKRKKRRVVAALIVNTVTASLFFLRQQDVVEEGSEKQLINETKVMLRRYLAAYVD